LKNSDERIIIGEVLETLKEKTVSSLKIHKTNGSLFLAYTDGEIETYKFLRPKSSVLRPKLKL